MGKLAVGLRRLLGNKNTVTIVGVILGVVVIYIGYTTRVQQAIEPQQVPFAKEELIGNTQIDRDDIGVMEVSKRLVEKTPELVTNQGEVIGKYVSFDCKIPEGALFYRSQLKSTAQKPNYITEDIAEGYTIFSLPVDMHTTYANSIMPDDYIDLFLFTTNEDGKIIVAELIESIKVKDVRDEQGKSVFSSMSTTKIPTELIFAVPDDIFNLLYRTTEIGGMEIFPVPRNKEYTETSETRNNLVAKDKLIDLINSRSDLSYND